MKNIVFFITLLVFTLGIGIFIYLDWNVDGFELFKAQEYEFYFQSWVSISGLLFSSVMAITTFFIYKKSKLPSMLFISLSFFLNSLAFVIIGYHTSYCKVCSDLSLCGASHNYSNAFTMIAMIILILTFLLLNVKNSIISLRIFSFGLITGSLLVLIALFISIEFIEIPDFLLYEFYTINLQGFVFVFPLILIILSLMYFKTLGTLSKAKLSIFVLLFLAFIPQAYHVFICKECHIMECSEFYVFAGLIMFLAMGLIVYAISLEKE